MKIDFTSTQRGFIQIPAIIILILGTLFGSGVGYFIIQAQNTKKMAQEKEQQITELAKEIEVLKLNNSASIVSGTKSQTSTVSNTPQKQQSDDLRIAQCEATRKATYSIAIAKVKEIFDKAKRDEFATLNQDMQRQIDQIYATSDRSKTAFLSLNITPDAMTSNISSNSFDTEILIDRMKASYQTAWYNRRNELDASYQTSVNKLNATLDQDYLTCLSK